MTDQPKSRNDMLSERGKMFAMGLAMLIPLAFLTISAFWGHIETLEVRYQNGAKFGAMGGEVALILLLYLHCYNSHIGVRRWSLWLGLVLGIVILIHGAGLYGLHEAEKRQSTTEAKLQSSLTEMSKEQAAGIASSNAQAAVGRSQRERLAIARRAADAQSKVAANAQEALAKEIKARDQKIIGDALFPEWYLKGPMYGLIFIVALLIMTFVFSRMLNREDIDRNFDGTPDHEEDRIRQDREQLAEERRQWEMAQKRTETAGPPVVGSYPAPPVVQPRAGNGKAIPNQ